MLDAAGFEDAKIFASNDLDEYIIWDLKAQGAKIDVWGVGTALITSKGSPALGGVYKLVRITSYNVCYTKLLRPCKGNHHSRVKAYLSAF